MKYDPDNRDARAFGFPPALFLSIEGERAHGCARHEGHERARIRIAYLKRLREESAAAGVGARGDRRSVKITVASVLTAAAVALAAALL
jgi:hypothetical protein